MNTNNFFFKRQYAFRENHSTVHPIFDLLNQRALYTNEPEPEFTLAIFCDLSKAFDVISHDILLRKLHYYGIRGIAHDWFKTYLTDRVQYVEIDGHTSSRSQIKCGFPEVSILYLVYVNDICFSCNGSIIQPFMYLTRTLIFFSIIQIY